MGTLLKDASDEFIDVMYAMCAMSQRQQKKESPPAREGLVKP
jgi:hypothetical protein